MVSVGDRVIILYNKPNGKIEQYRGQIERIMDKAIVVKLVSGNKTLFYRSNIKKIEVE